MGPDPESVAEAEAWLRTWLAPEGTPEAGFAQVLLHDLEQLRSIELLAETASAELDELRAVRLRARVIAETATVLPRSPGPRQAVLTAHYIATGEAHPDA